MSKNTNKKRCHCLSNKIKTSDQQHLFGNVQKVLATFCVYISICRFFFLLVSFFKFQFHLMVVFVCVCARLFAYPFYFVQIYFPQKYLLSQAYNCLVGFFSIPLKLQTFLLLTSTMFSVDFSFAEWKTGKEKKKKLCSSFGSLEMIRICVKMFVRLQFKLLFPRLFDARTLCVLFVNSFWRNYAAWR